MASCNPSNHHDIFIFVNIIMTITLMLEKNTKTVLFLQSHGGAGLNYDSPLPYFNAAARALRLADGPDEVHRRTVAAREYRRHGINSDHMRRVAKL